MTGRTRVSRPVVLIQINERPITTRLRLPSLGGEYTLSMIGVSVAGKGHSCLTVSIATATSVEINLTGLQMPIISPSRSCSCWAAGPS